jgi:hypothetical protein
VCVFVRIKIKCKFIPENNYTDRGVDILTKDQKVQLGEYEEAVPMENTAVNNEVYQDAYKEANMETFNINKTLDREYPVSTIVWNTSAAESTILGVLQFPTLLFNQQYIAAKIADYRLFRGGIRLAVKVTAAYSLYGKILVSYEPMPHTNAYSSNLDDVVRCSQTPHMIVSATAAETAVFDVPFIDDRRFLDLQDFVANEMGQFTIMVLNPLTNALGDPATATIFVTGQFLDAELMLPHDSQASLVQQSFTIQSSTNFKGFESKIKAENGTISSALDNMGTIAGVISDTPIVAPYTNTFKIGAKAVSGVTKMVGLDKPSSVAMGTIMKINPFLDFSFGRGIDNSIKLAMDPENQISTRPVVGGITQDEMQMSYILGTPSLVSTVAFNSSTSPTILANLGPADQNITYVDFVTANFQYYSGTYAFKFYITASKFHNVRGVFYLSDDGTAQAWENCYHMVVAFNGDAEVSFNVTYPNSYVVQNVTSPNNFSIYFKVLAFETNDSSLDLPIYINTYKAGASDFRVSMLRDVYFQIQSNPRMDFQKAFEPLHPSFTGYDHKNVISGEEYKSIRDIIHRYWGLFNQQGENIFHYNGLGNLGNGQYCGVELFGLLFRFWHGSMRVKLVSNDRSTYNCALIYNEDTNSYYPGIGVNSMTNPLVEIDIPWYYQELFKSTTPINQLNIYPRKVTGVSSYQFTSAGDDFSFMFLGGGIPNGSFVTGSPVNKGNNGFRVYLASAP